MRLAPMRSARRPQMTRPLSEPMPARLNTVAAAIALTPWSMTLDAMWKIGPECAAQHAKGVSAIAAKLGRAESLAHRERRPTVRAGGNRLAVRVRVRIAHEQREGDDDEPREVADHQHGDPPVVRGDEPARDRADDGGPETQSRRHEGDGEASIAAEP